MGTFKRQVVKELGAAPIPRSKRLRISMTAATELGLVLVEDEDPGDVSALQRSIEETEGALFEPITATADGDIVNGYRRFVALEKAGFPEFEVVFLRITTAQAQAMIHLLRPQKAERLKAEKRP
ncbi:MAG: ParB N-terminal domain-containing protein [Cyanobacteria bacterium SZAS LIN-3]|nr:ParB N-terminal domain-containing protein [Cyanobacteria bacterium SZAS LIN-3]